MAKKVGIVYVPNKQRKRPGRHSKKHKGKKKSSRGQGHPS
jgi:hypothetical protein